MLSAIFGKKKPKGNLPTPDTLFTPTEQTYPTQSDEYIIVDEFGAPAGTASPYPSLSGEMLLRASDPTTLPYALSTGASVKNEPINCEKLDMLSGVEFKLSPQIISDSDSNDWTVLERRCKEVVYANVIQQYQYDFRLENSVV